MIKPRAGMRLLSCAVVLVSLATAGTGIQAGAVGRTCRRVEFEGDVSAGQQWQTPIGQGWIFRVLPVSPLNAGYTGWDLAVDREPPAGYPDALLLATLPYKSLNEREIATTFGLRAQDVLGWNPRTFHFLTNPTEFRAAQRWFGQLMAGRREANRGISARTGADLEARLRQLQSHASSGQFRILDARIVPGIADPQPFAQTWAREALRTNHEIEQAPAGQASPRGKIIGLRFAVSLWVPQGWKVPLSLRVVNERCPE